MTQKQTPEEWWELHSHTVLTESDEETNKHFKDKARKECPRFANSRKLSVKVCKTWFDS